MSYTVTIRDRSYVAGQFYTALRTLLWYVLPPALLMFIVTGFIFGLMYLHDARHEVMSLILSYTWVGAGAGLFVWLLRQFVRILQVASYYTR